MCIFKTAHAENKERGYDGPLCSLQIDLITVAKVEYATAYLIRFVRISGFLLFGVASRSLQPYWYVLHSSQ